MLKNINLNINNTLYNVSINENDRLIDVLRDKLKLTGTKEGCGEGECGACSVIIDGEIVNSCLVMAFQVQDKKITTIEGVKDEYLKQSFIDVGAVQCGFCTPGMILSGKVILDQNQNPTKEQIRESISGNLCRCTGYNKIIDAIYNASKIRGDK
ncbi:(2Fe-2S)-binding protein [Romboutsia lituseburensis]|uniref:Purine hydroxylase delta subunit apoprotein n=1 Tax=Romboutsia lituseburensis DSM 797 TaxID=1121325 RepID=A0A1G9M7B5_9FIRM|nr:Xanthine dehydrogenase, molybdenum binding subunit [Romboutsia lituseburensis]SDL70024.1 purine hydroxylase delta subunit apoprotein [Romboutsia lituseburensis DSM 797]